MSRAISDAWFYRIKAATRDVIVRVGGVVRAGEITLASKTEASRWQSANDEAIIPLAAVLALEAECGLPLITEAMADLQGRRLADEVAEADSKACIARDNAEVMRRAAEVMAAMAAALADGAVSPAEAERVDRFARDLDQAVADLRRNLASVRAGRPALRTVGEG